MFSHRISANFTPEEHPEPAQDNEDENASIASSDMSLNSTEMFEHEPFDTFQSKVSELCRREWPHICKDALIITRMDGGSYNRVIGVQIDGSEEQASWLKRQVLRFLRFACSGIIRKTEIRDYILRIPRSEHAWIEHEVAILKFLAITNVPVPRIRTFNLSADNPIGSPYMIQPRLLGKSGLEVYLELNTQQRIFFARELGSALKKTGNMKSPSPGNLDPDAILAGSPNTQVLRLHCPPRNAFRYVQSVEPFILSTPQTVYEFFVSQFTRQRAYDLTLHRKYLNPWKPFKAIVQHLHKLGLLNENHYALTHMDLKPRNILIHVTSPTTTNLSAVLDWDETVFAPVFTNCHPPFWLWDTGDDDDEEMDEAAANVIPKDGDSAAVKKAFEEAAGEKYCKWAFTTEYRLARGIAKLAIMGISSSNDYEIARRIVKEWNEMHEQTGLEVCGIFDDEEDA
ncbi:hypothetical protein G6011_02053 [Alternaria panax]|uniref:Aminoglycoside phosphotransferase domain-containing protein n=1 Tax=Alternaria panax TaxID=48097 RepID=A0AAD4I473_9PLEO|nr:hypothetical protein G6011_02053 [Alternaria panax]